MKQPEDNLTPDLLNKPRRGRPPTGCAMSAADRVRKYRERAGLVTLTVELPVELVEQFNDFLKFKDLKKSDVIAKLLVTQLLRKR